jgi:hypothetical protein
VLLLNECLLLLFISLSTQSGKFWIHTRTLKNTGAVLQAKSEVGLQVNTEETKFLVMSRHQHVGQNHKLLRANEHLTSVAKFKYLEAAETNKIVFKKKLVTH